MNSSWAYEYQERSFLLDFFNLEVIKRGSTKKTCFKAQDLILSLVGIWIIFNTNFPALCGTSNMCL
jgi:hypothetical protein